MVVGTAVAAIVGVAYGIYAGETQGAAARKGRRKQEAAQRKAMNQQSAGAARSQGREAQARRGRQIAIANAANASRPGAAPGASSDANAVGTARTLG